MVGKAQKKETLRARIITAAKIYSSKLAGKTFLYIFGNESFELLFKKDRFVHLTGVDTTLYASSFYNKAKNGTLTDNQFDFSSRHPFEIAKKKLQCLEQLPCLTDRLVCIVKDMSTINISYKLGLTNLEFTLGLTENTDHHGNATAGFFVPRTLRVRDHAIENSNGAEFVDYILVKDGSQSLYDTIMFCDTTKSPPEYLSSKLTDTLQRQLYKMQPTKEIEQLV